MVAETCQNCERMRDALIEISQVCCIKGEKDQVHDLVRAALAFPLAAPPSDSYCRVCGLLMSEEDGIPVCAEHPALAATRPPGEVCPDNDGQSHVAVDADGKCLDCRNPVPPAPPGEEKCDIGKLVNLNGQDDYRPPEEPEWTHRCPEPKCSGHPNCPPVAPEREGSIARNVTSVGEVFRMKCGHVANSVSPPDSRTGAQTVWCSRCTSPTVQP